MSRSKTIALTTGTLVAGAVLAAGVTGIANAAGSTPGPGASTTSSATATAPPGDRALRGPGGPGRPAGPGMHGAPGSQALHSEAVVKAADGTISTVASIRGSVTAVSATSITVKAEDGFTATYAVDSSTGVHTGVPARPKPADGASAPPRPNDASTIADVKVGDVADVRGTASGSTTTATMIRSMTAAQADQLQADRLAHGQDD